MTEKLLIILFYGIIFVVMIICMRKYLVINIGKMKKEKDEYIHKQRIIAKNNMRKYVRNPVRSETVGNQLRKIDPYFNDEKFLAFAKNLFIKLQLAWSERNIEIMETIETDQLFQQHSTLLNEYAKRKQINKVERMCINYAELVQFYQEKEKDIIIVALNATMTDYVVDEVTGKVLRGSKEKRLTNTYKLMFSRDKGANTEDKEELRTTNCPNCGAPTTVISSGRCEYCNEVFINDLHSWLLADMRRF